MFSSGYLLQKEINLRLLGAILSTSSSLLENLIIKPFPPLILLKHFPSQFDSSSSLEHNSAHTISIYIDAVFLFLQKLVLLFNVGKNSNYLCDIKNN